MLKKLGNFRVIVYIIILCASIFILYNWGKSYAKRHLENSAISPK